MKPRIKQEELYHKAAWFGFAIQKECGGYRLIKRHGGGITDIYPNGGICPVVPARDIMIFLEGYNQAQRDK